MRKKVVVIGGGASGMMAAGVAASNGHNVTLLEKNDRLGKKLFITGKGRCNITNAADVETLLTKIPGNPLFLYSSLYSFDTDATRAFFQKLGVPTKIERGNRVFPVSDKSGDVVAAMKKFLSENRVNVRLQTEAAEIKALNKRMQAVVCNGGEQFAADTVVVATGGLSYPTTGSTGDGYRFARVFGHTVSKLHPSLVPLLAKESWVEDLQGVSLKNIGIDVKIDGKSVYKDFGEMMFTHFGVSGPVVLSVSRALIGRYDKAPVIYIDLKPALAEKELDNRILRDFEKYSNKDFINSLDDLLPQKMIPVFVMRSGVLPHKKVHDITKAERKAILDLFKRFTVTIRGTRGFREAVITNGGVCVDEIDPSTMQSKLINGLYFTGEVLDVDGFTGGLNLQIAFSTGFLAGSSI